MIWFKKMDETSYGGIFCLQMAGTWVAPSCGQIRNQFKLCQVMVKFRTDPCYAIAISSWSQFLGPLCLCQCFTVGLAMRQYLPMRIYLLLYFMFSPMFSCQKACGGVCNGVCGAVPGHICPISPHKPPPPSCQLGTITVRRGCKLHQLGLCMPPELSLLPDPTKPNYPIQGGGEEFRSTELSRIDDLV